MIGSGEALSLPAVVFDQQLNDPDTGTSADIVIQIDADGFGQAAFTNIVLGEASTPFGVLPIEAVRVQAEINLLGLAAGDPADYTSDGAVDQADYQRWVQEYGDSGPAVTADGNDDQSVDAADYTIWRDRFESPLDNSASAAAPEPGAAVLAATLLLAGVTRRR